MEMWSVETGIVDSAYLYISNYIREVRIPIANVHDEACSYKGMVDSLVSFLLVQARARYTMRELLLGEHIVAVCSVLAVGVAVQKPRRTASLPTSFTKSPDNYWNKEEN